MTVSEQIISVINILCEKFGIVIDWTTENAVPYLEILFSKLINYEIATSIVKMAIIILLSIGSIVATKKFYPTFKDGWRKNAESNCDIGWQVASVFAIIGLIIINFVAILVVNAQIMDIIQCTIFPEMYIFEYVKSLT